MSQRRHAQPPGEAPHAPPGDEQVQRSRDAHRARQRQEEPRPVERVEQAGLIIRQQRRSRPVIRIPQRKLPGTQQFPGVFTPGVKLERRQPPEKHIPQQQAVKDDG
ncbi:MAG: hypothetical protein H6671_04335 [Anaerolineaceae bacterium]|nr:hypothetical protein [Anaerolineaceae bacterium]